MRHHMDRKSFDRARSRCGSDCWNPDHIWRQAFRDPDVTAAAYDYVGTGLWADIQVCVNSAWIERRIYG